MNTLQYLTNRLSKPDDFGEWVSDIIWEDSKVCNPIDYLERFYQKVSREGNRVVTVNKTEDGRTKKSTIEYTENLSSLDIVKMKKTTHDGTLLFVQWAIQELFENLLLANTFSHKNKPENYDTEEEFFKYDMVYYVSDLLWNSKYVDHVSPSEGKMFPGQRDCFAMAVQLKYVLKSE